MAGPHCGVSGFELPPPAFSAASEAALRNAVVGRLAAAGCVAADEEADELLLWASDHGTLEGWLERRQRGEPLAWITGTAGFCGQDLHVAPGLYVPRPQSEELARRAAAVLPAHGRALDLCTGVGAIAAHLATDVPTAEVFGVDIDLGAAVCARRNGVRVFVADIDGALRVGGDTLFDVVTAVAPYVPTDALRLLPADVQRYEPRAALDGGVDGLDLVRRVVTAAGSLLCHGGWLLVEVGGAQDDALAPALFAGGFGESQRWCDEDGELRGVMARMGRPLTGHL